MKEGHMINRRSVIIGASLLPISSAWGQSIPGRISRESDQAAFVADKRRVEKRLASFFNIVAARSKASPPPAVNAANGWFVNAMKTDAELEIAQREISVSSGDGRKLAMIAYDVMKICRGAFGPGTHFATGLTYAPVAVEALKQALPSALKIAGEIIAAVYTSGESLSVTDINTDLQTMITDIGSRGPVLSGDHANGWISVNLRNGAEAAITRIEIMKSGAFSADARDFANIVQALLVSMTKLDTNGHDPWLKAVWQLGFTAICETGAKVMLNPPD